MKQKFYFTFHCYNYDANIESLKNYYVIVLADSVDDACMIVYKKRRDRWKEVLNEREFRNLKTPPTIEIGLDSITLEEDEHIYDKV